MSETGHAPLIITQSDDGRVVTIDGYRFATDLLRQITASPLGERFRIVSREDGVISISVERDPLEYAAAEMLAALLHVRKLISEAAMTGFNCQDGDWAERLFASQQVTSAAIAKATTPKGV